jgi:phosphoribosyl-ATP pyrophosphohydrolase/phosphoribosyl-AMP cyclohydrolase
MSMPATSSLKFGPDGLLPAVVQTPGGDVRMVAYVNAASLAITVETGWVTFWSRSRNELWTKGATSGNRLRFKDAFADCDGDALLILAEPEGPTCHNGTDSCFTDMAALPWLDRLETLLKARKASANPDGSYTQKLFTKGPERIAKKVVEEAGEVAIAAMALLAEPTQARRDDFINEAADLIFHLQVLLVDRGFSLADAAQILRDRHEARS